jgi:hypothetical protein
MPVIRGTPPPTITPEKRAELERRLGDEIDGKTAAGGPLIFEIPLGRTGNIDVMVVWDDWEGVRSEDRSDIILEVYKQRARDEKVMQALGVTHEEALGENLLPYEVYASVNGSDDAVVQAKLVRGGIQKPRGNVVLRFPTTAMAEANVAELNQALPSHAWAIRTLGRSDG